MTTPRSSHRLLHEKSPYLLQHAHNPVDWYPWGEEALQRARDEDKPIFLSIGYSTCHWCHVMERESFEDRTIAALMNQHFVCIKVDREERPDLDEVYMNAVQAMIGQGGWPLNVWLTPELEPFYGGTYFPPDDRYGRPGFPLVLESIARAWSENRAELTATAERLTAHLQQLSELGEGGGALGRVLVDTAYEQLASMADRQRGGWGTAPKFPRADYGALCLRVYHRSGDERALEMLTTTLDAMANGGIYDHLGGGFARYSTDADWRVPHFEKMLYDNAQLALHYVEAFQLTQDAEYARVARETFDYVLRDLTHPDGAFYSAEDADSEGVEGKFYVWSLEEVERLLPEESRALFVERYGMSAAGNWEGHNILERTGSVAELAARHGLDESEARARLDRARALLLEARSRRVRPGLDDKVLTAWNGLMIEALARGSVVLQEPRYRQAAERASAFLLERMRDGDGLLRRWRDGEARFPGYAEDYAMLVRGLLELYQASFELRWLEAARELHDEMTESFGDPQDGALFHTRRDRRDLIVRVKTGYDGSTPSANSVAAQNALRLFELTGEDRYGGQVERMLRSFQSQLAARPLALISMLLAVDSWLSDRVELVLAGEPDDPSVSRLLQRARSGYHPDLTVALAPGSDGFDRALAAMPALEGKRVDDGVRAHVCRGFACRQPTADADEMMAQLSLTRVARDR